MRAKQVTALMMAATLAVTGNGVTAFAEPVANVEAGDAAQQTVVGGGNIVVFVKKDGGQSRTLNTPSLPTSGLEVKSDAQGTGT